MGPGKYDIYSTIGHNSKLVESRFKNYGNCKILPVPESHKKRKI